MNSSPLLTHLQTIDLHYHAGLERSGEQTLEGYLRHAWETGRRWQGVTDHIDLYIKPHTPGSNHRAYAWGVDGLAQLRDEMRAFQLPGLRTFFAPEYATTYRPDGEIRYSIDAFPADLVPLADYIICDTHVRAYAQFGIEAHTEAYVRAIGQIRRLVERTGRLAYLAHPLRYVIDPDLFRRKAPERVALAEPAAQSGSVEALNNLFLLDLPRLGRASREYGIPFEVNGTSQYRFRAGCPNAFPAYLRACEIMAEAGATFVPGSDQHNIEDFWQVEGRIRPFETVGEAIDWGFLEGIGIGRAGNQTIKD